MIYPSAAVTNKSFILTLLVPTTTFAVALTCQYYYAYCFKILFGLSNALKHFIWVS